MGKNKIDDKRLELGWTQQKLADILGCSVRTVQSWNCDKYPHEWTENLILDRMARVDREAHRRFCEDDCLCIGEASYEIYQAASSDWCCTVSSYGCEDAHYNLTTYEHLLEFILDKSQEEV